MYEAPALVAAEHVDTSGEEWYTVRSGARLLGVPESVIRDWLRPTSMYVTGAVRDARGWLLPLSGLYAARERTRGKGRGGGTNRRNVARCS